MTVQDALLIEARNLIRRLEAELYYQYEDHPIGGRVPKNGNGTRIRKLKKLIRGRAYRRLARRAAAAGNPLPISRNFAMWVVNHQDSTSL